MGIRYDSFYYVRTLEKVQIALLDVFNDIRINKYSGIDRKQIVKTIKVPLVTHFDKNFANWYENQLVKKPLMPLPILGFRYKGVTANPRERTQSTYPRQIFSKATEDWLRDIQPTPYYANYSLTLLCDQLADYGQVLENILPYFNPNRHLRIKEFDWAPDLERKIQVELVGNNTEFQEEIKNDATHRYITFTIDFRCSVDLYRVFELADLIKYAELNIETDGIVDKKQAIVFPSDIIEGERKPWETTGDTIDEGFSILKTQCTTLLKQVDQDGNVTYENISVNECENRPTNVPDVKQLDLWFDVDSDSEPDHSPYGRDFLLLNMATRNFIPGFAPGNGEEVSGGGYEVDPNVSWNNILTWFGTNNGLNQSPYTFRIKLQFTQANMKDCVFQQLKNKETAEIPEGSVYFDWGLMDGKLYFSFATYGTNALNYTFKTNQALDLNNTDVYYFMFALYDSGKSGIFAYSINDSDFVVLQNTRS